MTEIGEEAYVLLCCNSLFTIIIDPSTWTLYLQFFRLTNHCHIAAYLIKSNATPNYFRPSRKIEESIKLMPRRFTKMTYVTEKVGIKGNKKKAYDAIAILKG
jgi:hypothetical protein